MRLVNFAYGELITAGGYTLALLSGAPGIVAIIVCFAVVVALALLQERIAFRPLRGASPATMLITTFAVSFLLQNVYLLAFGSRGSDGRHARRPQQGDRRRLAADPLDHDRRRDRRRGAARRR